MPLLTLFSLPSQLGKKKKKKLNALTWRGIFQQDTVLKIVSMLLNVLPKYYLFSPRSFNSRNQK